MKKNIITIAVLLILTLLTAITSMYYSNYSLAALIILLLSALKFILVSFQFMELKKAHSLWKVLTIGYLSIFLIIVTIVLY